MQVQVQRVQYLGTSGIGLRLPRHASLTSASNMRGDRVRLGWRALLGVVLVGVVVLHGFDRSFSLDGYSLSLLSMLLILALAGELESAKFAGLDVRFRRQTLLRIEAEVDDLPPPNVEPADGDADETAASEMQEERTEPMQADLRSLAREEPRAAAIAFFVDVERAVGRLYETLQGVDAERVPFRRQVDVLARYGVIPLSEARIVLDLAGLRNAYVHGRAVDPDEAARLLAVGARILPSLSNAKRTVGHAFERQVNEILESTPGISFERESRLLADGVSYQADFVITSPARYIVEARLMSRPLGDPRLRDLLTRTESFQAKSDLDGALIVVPRIAAASLARLSADTSLTVLPINHLKAWLEQLVKQRP